MHKIKLMVLTQSILITLIFLWLGNSYLVAEKQKNQKVIDQILKKYEKEGGKDFSAQRGYQLWKKKYQVKGKLKNCVDCHGNDLTKEGTHIRSGKKIKPMSAWTINTRYSKEKKVEKWFKRNCKSTWGRECTPQEKGDFLVYLRAPYDPQQ